VSMGYAQWRPARALARSVELSAGFGGLCGLLALLALAVAGSADAGNGVNYQGLLLGTLFAIVTGAVVGLPCGLGAFAALALLALVSAPGRRPVRARPAAASWAAGTGAAAAPSTFAVLVWLSGDRGWAIAWLCAGALALAAGIAVGPFLMYGPERARARRRPPQGRQPEGQTQHPQAGPGQADLHSAW
jgi:hypothetical protein